MAKQNTKSIEALSSRLDALESAVRELSELLRAQVGTAPAKAVMTASKPASDSAAVAAPKAKSTAKPKPVKVSPPEDKSVVPAPSNLEQVITALFEAILLPDLGDAYEALTALTHSDELLAPRALDHLKAFSWKRFRASVSRYLSEGTSPGSFTISRHTPTTIDESVKHVKVFLSVTSGGSAPIQLRRDSEQDGAWRITQISL